MAAAALGICLLAAAGPARADDWAAYQHDVNHTGRSTASFDPRTLTKAWTSPPNFSTPLISGNSVIATKNGQGVGSIMTEYASFDLADGSLNWSVSRPFSFPSQAAVGEGLVVYAGSDRNTSLEALYVHDAATGAFKYSVPLTAASGGMPTIHRDPTSGQVSAYYATNGSLTAVTLGATSGSVRWSGSGSFGDASIPTVAGESVVVAGPGNFYAFRRTDGQRNQFFDGTISGGGGTTPAFDAARNRLYVLEARGSGTGENGFDVLTAYDYVNNATITQRWFKTGPGVRSGASVAIGPDGKVYSVDNVTILELDPDTGATLRSPGGHSFANQVTPALHNGYLWAFGDQTQVYSLDTLSLVRSIPGSRGSLNSSFDSPGAIDDTHFIIDYGTIVGRPGFDVYVVPEPSCAAAGLAAAGALALARRRRAAVPNSRSHTSV